MNKIYSTAIIGGGASGLISAIELLNNGVNADEIVIIEGQDRVGKKLIATGNGQGNLMNADFNACHYHGEKGFIDNFVAFTKNLNLEDYFYRLGVPLITDEKGRKYPLSKQASAVLDVLREKLDSAGVKTITGFKVTKITEKNDVFTAYSDGGEVQARKVVLAVGGSSGKQFGTDGTSYILAEKFLHTKTVLYPSLVQLKTNLDKIRALKGLKENALVYAYDGNKLLATYEGDVLFTEFGVSGNAIFYLSAYLSGAKQPKIKIEFIPQYTLEQAEKLISDRKKFSPTQTQERTLGCIVNKRIGSAVYKSAKSDSAKDLAYALKNFELTVTGTLGFNNAQVTKGGIRTNEIDYKTYESKFKQGLYLVGEVLDIDGDCGGYNLTFAFVSAIACARAIAKKDKE